MTPPLLAIDGLGVTFPGDREPIAVVRDVGFEVGAGEFVGLVGESGSGKSLTALAALQLVPHPGRISGGSVRYRGEELVGAGEKRLRQVRGGGIGLVFQEPGTALNPVLTIGFQIVEAIRAHLDVSRAQARTRATELLDRVAMPSPESRLDDYPHQLSGGQRQRAMIALALAAEPDLLIADEPTTALDVTVQAQILELLASLRRDLGLAVLLITHDLAVVAETCERVLVMYAGTVVESAPVADLFEAPGHPYTRGLLASVPVLGQRVERGRLPSIPGRVPNPSDRPRGCAFHPRCPEVFEPCDGEEPALLEIGADRKARCYLWE